MSNTLGKDGSRPYPPTRPRHRETRDVNGNDEGPSSRLPRMSYTHDPPYSNDSRSTNDGETLRTDSQETIRAAPQHTKNKHRRPPVPHGNSQRNSALASSIFAAGKAPPSASETPSSTLDRGFRSQSVNGRLYETTADKTRSSSTPKKSRSRSKTTVSLLNHTIPRSSLHGRPRVDGMSHGGSDQSSGGSNERRRFQQGSPDTFKNFSNDVMANYLYQEASQKALLVAGEAWQGVVLKRARGDYACCPPGLSDADNGLYAAAMKMNVRCAMVMDTHVTQIIFESTEYAGFDYVPLPDGLRVQVIPTMNHLPACQLHHFAAFILDLEVLVVWDDDPDHLLERAQDLQLKFVRMVWEQGDNGKDSPAHGHGPGAALSAVGPQQVQDARDLEAATEEQPRRVMLMCAFVVSCTLCMSIVCLAIGWRNLAYEIVTDGLWGRLGLLSTIPLQLFTCNFFFQALVGNISQMFGPTSQLFKNSRCFSGKPPSKRLVRDRDYLPHLTIQMPVYREGLQTVIRPTVLSIKAAISSYEMQGGTASIFVNDDGMQLASTEAAQARRDFYDEHKIGWVARPGHGALVGAPEKPFHRRGKFKKASNMNFCLNVTNQVEDKLEDVERSSDWTQDDEDRAYERALAAVLSQDEGRTWAAGNIRIGEYILLVDSDTRIPRDCILDAVTEMEQSPKVAILQFTAGVLNVTDSFFERGATWFTDMIYTYITFAVAGGDATPFVGHNAVLRWEAIQTGAKYLEPKDGYEKYWSEDHVSEDFAMALNMLSSGFTLRYAGYQGDGFKEGVSLTVYDELARWEKYAYGVSEVIFHPFSKWITRGPFTPLFRTFILARKIPIAHKCTILAYLGTYYAMGSAFMLTGLNYFLTGWEFGLYDKFYRDSFSIFFAIIVVFTGLGNTALAALRYRTKQGGLLENFLKNIVWIPFFTIFLGGVSLHLSQAILCHLFSIDMSWGTTAKEAEEVVFGKEAVRILNKFKGTFFICFLSIAAMVYMGIFAPYNWRITQFASIFPLAMVVGCHLLLPLALSPALMRLNW